MNNEDWRKLKWWFRDNDRRLFIAIAGLALALLICITF